VQFCSLGNFLEIVATRFQIVENLVSPEGTLVKSKGQKFLGSEDQNHKFPFFYIYLSEVVADGIMVQKRTLNAIETLFAVENVRFALLLVMPVDDEETLNDEISRLATLARSTRLGNLLIEREPSMDVDAEETWTLTQELGKYSCKPTGEGLLTNQRHNNELDLKDYGRILENLVQKDTESAEGGLTVKIGLKETKDGKRKFLYVNGNHAMVDGRSLTHFLSVLAGLKKSSLAWKTQTIPNWRNMVMTSTGKMEKWSENPPFIEGENKTLTFRELSTDTSSSGQESFRFCFPVEVLKSVRKVIKICAPGTTVTGLLAAATMQSLRAEYKGTESRDIAVSMLVDLRPFIEIMDEINQAHGTVTLIYSAEKFKAPPVDFDCFDNFDHVLQAADCLTKQLREKILRGEAHRAALAVTNGEYEKAGPTATFELSNLGVCEIPMGAELFTSQRFDGYDGVSCLVHSESPSEGSFRWNVSVGTGLDSNLVERVFANAVKIFRHIAKLKRT